MRLAGGKEGFHFSFGACNGFGSKLDRILLNSQHLENSFILFNSTKCLNKRTTPMSNILCLEHIGRSMSISPNDRYIYAPLKEAHVARGYTLVVW